MEGRDLSPLVSTSEATPGLFLHFWASQYERDVDMLESVTKGHKDNRLKYLSHEERLREL